MKELLSKIGINQAGYFSSDKNYVIDFDSDTEFNKAFSRLDKSSLVEENEDSSVVNLNITNIMYLHNDYSLNLIADFEQGVYKLVVTELKED